MKNFEYVTVENKKAEKRSYNLIERIKVLAERNDLPETYAQYIKGGCAKILLTEKYYETVKTGVLRTLSLESLEEWNKSLYEQFYDDYYKIDFANPSYAVKLLGKPGSLLGLIYAKVCNMAPLAASCNRYMMIFYIELFEKACEIIINNPSEDSLVSNLTQLLKESYTAKLEYTHRYNTGVMVNPEFTFYNDIVNKCDLDDVRYLYWYGFHVTKNEIDTARFISSLTDEEVKAMADTFTEGFLTGYAKLNKDILTKKSVALIYTLGFEKMFRLITKRFNEMGLQALVTGHRLQTTSENRQAEYDYKDAAAAFLDKEYAESSLKAYEAAFEGDREWAQGHAGPLVLETFGEKEFAPQSKKEALSFSEEQQNLSVDLANKMSMIRVKYINPEERSFSIISYPVPEIGENFRKVFAETVKINTLDYKTYETIQQKLIDALDTADTVHIKGKGVNKTDLTVKICELKDPSKETAFENCVADVNIPVGEVFTSPVLKGTNGILHVTKVYLNGLLVRDLEIVLKDGMIESCKCGNFEDEQANRDFLDEVIMFHHKTLPIGEFAIGTNTTAYKAGIENNIQDKLPILIAEKTGPHFAMGDTCYSRAEDLKYYNPDGKEIVAKDNEVSLLRNTDSSKAYFNCHTDITIPYNELDTITAVKKDGTTVSLIEDGRFVLPGTEELNRPLDEMN